MIFAEWKPIDEMMDLLNGCHKVLLVGCATCVAECAAGGEKEVETLAPLLSLSFKERGQAVEILACTLEKQCEWEFVEDLAEKVGQVEAILSLACGIGVQALAERFSDKPVFPGVNTAALTIREKPGVWAARCAACGDCVLGDTFGCDENHTCIDACAGAECGVMNGVDCGDQPDQYRGIRQPADEQWNDSDK